METVTDPKTLELVLGFFKLNVKNLDVVTRFYEEAFGFVVDNTIKLPGVEERMLKLPGQEFTLVLLYRENDEVLSLGNRYGPIGIQTSDVEAVAANVIACGGTIEVEPVSFPGATVSMAKDPEGHDIELICLDGQEFELPEGFAT